jgi:P27 family predicted phage terminase small subunit
MDRAPKPPIGLGKAGRALWTRITGDVRVGWDLDERDLMLLEGACAAHDRVAELEAVARREGVTGKGSRGQGVVHPAIGEARLQRALSAQLLGRVELTAPAARTGHLNGRQRAELRRAESRGTTG